MVFKATEGAMRQDTSVSSRQAVVIGNRANNFNDTAIAAKLELAGAGNARQELSSLSLGFALIAAGSGIAAPAQGMSRSISLAPGDLGNDESADRRRTRDEDIIRIGISATETNAKKRAAMTGFTPRVDEALRSPGNGYWARLGRCVDGRQTGVGCTAGA